MKVVRPLLLALGLGLMSGTVSAQDSIAKLYYGAGFTDGSVDILNGEDKSLGTVSAQVGLQLGKFVGVFIFWLVRHALMWIRSLIIVTQAMPLVLASICSVTTPPR